MGQTLTHGIYLPDEGERNCYSGLAANWQILDTAVGTVAEHTTALAGKAPAVHTHTKADITDFPAYGTTAGTICEGNDSRLSDARTPVAHTHGKADITDLFNSANVWSGENTFTIPCKTLGKKLLTDITDLDDAYYNGEVCRFNPDTLHNPTGGYGNVLTINNAVNVPDNAYNSWITQIATTPEGTYLGTRNRSNGGAWTSWIRVLTEAYAIPTVNNTYDLGSSSYQWNNLYAKNYYYNGTAWGLDKANVWSNVNTFSNTLSITGNTLFAWDRPQVTIGTIPSSTVFYGTTRFRDSNNTSYAVERGAISTTWNYRQWFVHNFSNASINASFEIGIKHDGTEKYFLIDADKVIPNTTGVSNLGTSDKKWKTLNGVNPGALSLPNTYTNLDTTNWNLTGTLFSYTPPIDGWLFINIRPNNNYAYVAIEAPYMRSNSENTTGRNAMACIAVRADVQVTITLVGASIAQARLVTCAGNV